MIWTRRQTLDADRPALDHRGAEPAHLPQRSLAVAGLALDRAAAVLDHPDVVALLERVEHGVLDAVVGGEAEHVELADPALLEPIAQPGRLAVGVVEEA